MKTYYSYDGWDYESPEEVMDAICSNMDEEDLASTLARISDFSEIWDNLSEELREAVLEGTVDYIFANEVSEWENYDEDDDEDDEDDDDCCE